MKERNDRKNEAKLYNSKFEELQIEAQEQRISAEKAAKYQQIAEEELSRAQNNEQDRERQRTEELKSWKLLEKTLKDQVAELADEKYRLEGQLKELLDHAEGQEARLDKLTDLASLYQSEQQRSDELEAEVQRLQQDLSALTEFGKEGKSKAEEDCRAMKEELQRAAELVQRQERTISEMRIRRQEDQNVLSLLKDDLKTYSSEADKATARWRTAQEELQRIKDSHTDFEQTNQTLRRENADLLKQLQALVEKEEQERLERRQWAKVKMDLLSQREDEVSKLSEALESLPGDSKPSRASPYRRTAGAR
jgi:chromosome segregation ATPase